MLKNIINLSKPILPQNPLIAVDLFSGGGGVKTGMLMSGFLPHTGIEKDPSNPELSKIFIDCHDRNFGEYGSTTIFKTVQQMYLNDWAGVPRSPTLTHASPVCTHFSGYGKLNDYKEDSIDISAAKSVADAIAKLDSKYWTLEQVPQYIKSQSYQIICNALQANDYIFTSQKINFYDWGVTCQERERLFLIAWKRDRKPLQYPPRLPKWGWAETIKDIELYEQPKALQWMDEAIAKFTQYQAPEPLVIERTGKMNKNPKIRRGNDPMWTITKHSFHDHRHNSRQDPFNFYIPNKGYYLPHPRAIARICGFPDWFQLPTTPYHYGSLLGYAVPPTWIYHFLSHNFTLSY